MFLDKDNSREDKTTKIVLMYELEIEQRGLDDKLNASVESEKRKQ